MSYLSLKLWLSLLVACVLASSATAQTPPNSSPLTAEQYTEQGNIYAQEKQYDKAVDAYRQAINLDPHLAAAYHGLGRTYGNMGRVADSLEPLEMGVRLDPNNARAHLNLGITLAFLRRRDEAIAQLTEAKRLAPSDPSILNNIGNVLNNSLGRPEEALASYIEARRLNPNSPWIHHNIGLVLMRLGRASEAIAPLQEALRLDPQLRNARYLLSEAYQVLGRYEEAAESWSKFLELKPNGPEATIKRSWDYMYIGGHGAEAAADARNFLKLYGWHDEASSYLAIIASLGWRENGGEQEAQAILDEAKKKLNPANWPYPVVRYLKGEISGEELLQLATDNDKRTEAHAYLGMDLLLKGRTDEARTHLEWVKEYGNKRFYEYPLAVEELKRLGR